MYWREYFHLKIWKETSNGRRPYFEAQLQVQGDFTFEELKIRNFDRYALSDKELKQLSPELRKILLRLSSFNSREFERIGKIFCDRILEDKDNDLVLSTDGGGVYLFLMMMKQFPQGLQRKSISCRTSEVPLEILKIPDQIPRNIRLTYRPEKSSYMDHFPGLWQDSPALSLFEIDELDLKVS